MSRPVLPALLLLLASCGGPARPSAPPESGSPPAEFVPSETAGDEAEPIAREASPEAEEASVRPGVNDKYFEEGAAEEWTSVFEGESREVASRRDDIVALLGLRPGLAVADIGTGTGLFVEPLARGIAPDGLLYAVDIVPGFLEHVGARAEAAGLENVRLHRAEPRDVRLEAGSIDLAFMCNVYHHVEFPHAYMSSIAAALADGGELVLVDFERIPGVTSKRMLRHVRADKQTVIAEVEAAGFELVEEVDLLRENYILRFRPGRRGSRSPDE